MKACQGFLKKYYPTIGGVEIFAKTRRAWPWKAEMDSL